MDNYDAIFKRKSFHLFRDKEEITEDDLHNLQLFLNTIVPLYTNIKTKIVIVKEEETTCRRGGDYCLLFYSEKKDGYLQNVGYLGQQVDLYCAKNNIGSLWFGIGKVEEQIVDGLEYVIMIAIAKMKETSFRKDMFKAKRKSVDEIWEGNDLNIANIVRFSPSACNSQPWFVKNDNGILAVYRYKKEGKRGIMPANKVSFYNRIDIGIFMFMLETCLDYQRIKYERELFNDDGKDKEYSLNAHYRIHY